MENEKNPKDIMGIGQSEFKPYQTSDGWTVVTPGAESGRRQARGLAVVALSKVDIHLKSDENVKMCIHHLEESDRRFAQNVGQLWDWQKSMFKGHTVRFAVEWYDVPFFREKKRAYLAPDHARMYAHFGATVQDVHVRHFLVDAKGTETAVED